MIIEISARTASEHNIESTKLIVVHRTLSPETKSAIWYSAVPLKTYDVLPINLDSKDCKVIDPHIPADWIEVKRYDPNAHGEYIEQSFPEWASDGEYFDKLSDNDEHVQDVLIAKLKEYNSAIS